MAESLPPLPTQPAGTQWPTREWPRGTGPTAIPKRAESLLDAAFGADPPGELGTTHAVAIVQAGWLLAERLPAARGASDRGLRPCLRPDVIALDA